MLLAISQAKELLKCKALDGQAEGISQVELGMAMLVPATVLQM